MTCNPPCPFHPKTLDRLRDAVMRRHGLTLGDMLSRQRSKHHIRAREVYAGIARLLLPQPSYPEIAHAIGRRHHSTVMGCARRYASNPLPADQEDAIASAARVRLARHGVGVVHPQVSGALAERFLMEISRDSRATVAPMA